MQCYCHVTDSSHQLWNITYVRLFEQTDMMYVLGAAICQYSSATVKTVNQQARCYWVATDSENM